MEERGEGEGRLEERGGGEGRGGEESEDKWGHKEVSKHSTPRARERERERESAN